MHTTRYEHGRWRLWYTVGEDWERIGGTPFPRYHIRCVDTDDLHAIPREDTVCLRPQGSEYRIGRPWVYRYDGRYLMYFTRGNVDGAYFPGMAISDDGRHWQRCDAALGLHLASEGWDARTLCYPALIRHGDRVLMFYNGNDMGRKGFGVAEATLPAGEGADAFG